MDKKELEETIIGVLLEHPENISKSSLELADFTTYPWRPVFQAMRSITSEGLEVDVFVIHARLGSDVKELATMMTLQQTARENGYRVANLEYLASELKKLNRSEKLVELCTKALEAKENGHDADKLIARLITRLSEDSQQKKKDYNMKELTAMAVDYIDRAAEAKADGRTIGVPSGIDNLDENTGGLHKSDLIIVGARPAMGKTAFALNVAVNASRKNYKVGFISAEMSAEQMSLRLTSIIARVPSAKMRSGTLDDTDYSKIMVNADELQSLPIRLNDDSGASLAKIMIQSRAWQLSGGLDLLIVDYLQRMQSEERAENRNREIGKFTSGLKTIAKALNIPVMALSQINRDVTKKSEKRPSMADLRDSGEIEQEADMVMLLHRPGYYDSEADQNLAEIILDKNRHGPTAIVMTEWEAELMIWKGKCYG